MGQRNNEFSDYGSGNTSDSSTMSWGGPDRWASCDLREPPRQPKQRASSFVDLMMGRCTLDDVMQEFKMNGSDSPYTPDEDNPWAPRRQDELTGMGPSGAYLRQKSWPAPERTPAARLPPPRWRPDDAAVAEPVVVPAASTPLPPSELVSAEQARVLASLPSAVLYALLRDMEQERGDKRVKKNTEECRFCKNNGERESYYRSHALKDPAGRVRCPVLRAFVCRRCGARGDRAHTAKYCPLATNEERIKSAAMMRSVRLASGRRRASPPEYVSFGEVPPALTDHAAAYDYAGAAPLDPLWAALEQKLML